MHGSLDVEVDFGKLHDLVSLPKAICPSDYPATATWQRTRII